jgi:hypothetical protein
MHPGDYWQVPARALTGDVIWPREANQPNQRKYIPPMGVRHYFAPLALVVSDPAGPKLIDLRRIFDPDNGTTGVPRILQ